MVLNNSRRKGYMNIVLVIFDTLRKDCVGCYNSSPSWGKVRTSYLDSLAQESMIMTRAFPESLPTLPARRAIYTGQRVYPFKEGYFNLKGDFPAAIGWGPIPEEQDTISELLHNNGYRTCLISSVYHMFKPSKNYWRGFDQWDFIRGKESDPYKSGPLPTKNEIAYWLPLFMQNKERIDFVSKVIMNTRNMIQHEEYSAVAQVMIKASKWLEENKDAKKFFLVVESFDPHEPWIVPEHYRKIYDNNSDVHEQIITGYKDISDWPKDILFRTQANYSGLVTMSDRWFGYLYEQLKILDLLDNTLLIVTSDHGHSIGENNYLGKRGYPSRREVFDIPLMIRHPNKTGAGQRSNILVQHTDISALILKFAGIEPSKLIDGKDFWENAIKEKPIRDHVTIAWGSSITVVDDNWWLNCRVNGKGTFLYDLRRDLMLNKNIAENHPDVVNQLYIKALEDAGGKFPDYLMQSADREEDAPGCSPLAARKL